jgi:predicted CoA-binding protein
VDLVLAMKQLPPPVEQFLAGRRIAVAGVSRKGDVAANAVFKKLAGAGYDVVPVNPNATTVEGVTCYPDLAAVPGPLDGVVIATHPDVSAEMVRACGKRGVKRVWFHRSFGAGSVSAEAVEECHRLEIEPIVGGCPLMFCEPVDVGHRCMRWWLQRRGRVPA